MRWILHPILDALFVSFVYREYVTLSVQYLNLVFLLSNGFQSNYSCGFPQVASKTNDSAGDGTTTASVLARELINLGLLTVTSGANPVAIKKGIEKTIVSLVEELKKSSRPVKGREDIRGSWIFLYKFVL